MKPGPIGYGVAALLWSCSPDAREADPSGVEADAPAPSGAPVVAQLPPEAGDAPEAAAWESLSGSAGVTLRWAGSDGTVGLSIACLADPLRLSVRVPAFEPVTSEDRFALGLGDEPVTLVANPYEQDAPGVTGEGPVPENFGALLDNAAEVRALYGAQQTGPLPAPPPELKDRLAAACAATGV